MGCSKNKPKCKPDPGDYTCKKCNASAKKKRKLCKPKKVKE